jgi:hypothetical protein
MKKRVLSETEVLKGQNPSTAHADEVSLTNDKNWGSFFSSDDQADTDFMVERHDIFDIRKFEDQEDRELIQQRSNSPEIDVDIEDL